MSDGKKVATSEKKTVVEEGTEFKGTLSSKCPVVINGRMDGEVTAPSMLVSSSGAVKGKVKVGDIRSEGEIAGEFDADTVVLAGKVNNKTIIRAKSLEVKLASDKDKLQVSFGNVSLEVGDSLPKTMTPSANSNGNAQKTPRA